MLQGASTTGGRARVARKTGPVDPYPGGVGGRSFRASLAPLGVKLSRRPAPGPVGARGVLMNTHRAQAQVVPERTVADRFRS